MTDFSNSVLIPEERWNNPCISRAALFFFSICSQISLPRSLISGSSS
ncbi:hypothetical protein ACFOPQ_14650 [Deinococcus antarcticus]|uniref:Uncharacterized protein n=1 Tax=Deinococcus antarcticus TaxID=1298767 RepID=A0ABV8A9S6_9DEIO